MVCETANRPEARSTQQMLALDHPDRIQITFDDRRLVANAGLLLPVTLAQHLGLRELIDNHVGPRQMRRGGRTRATRC